MVLDGARQLRAPPDGRREDAALNALDHHERGLEPRDEAPIHAPSGGADANYRVACFHVPEGPTIIQRNAWSCSTTSMPTVVRGAVSCVVLSGAAESASRKTSAMLAAAFRAVFASRELTLDNRNDYVQGSKPQGVKPQGAKPQGVKPPVV